MSHTEYTEAVGFDSHVSVFSYVQQQFTAAQTGTLHTKALHHVFNVKQSQSGYIQTTEVTVQSRKTSRLVRIRILKEEFD